MLNAIRMVVSIMLMGVTTVVMAQSTTQLLDEIEEHIIDVCYTELGNKDEVLSRLPVPIKNLVELAESTNKDSIGKTYDATILVLLKFMSYEERKTLYVLIAQVCKYGGWQGYYQKH